MTLALTVFLVIFAIVLHEGGHAFYMQKYGIPIEKFSIGLPFPLCIRFKSKNILGGATIQLTPLLLGAYVKPTEEGAKMLESRRYSECADIYGAGVLANLLFAYFLFLVYNILDSNAGLLPGLASSESIKSVLALGLLFIFRKIFSRFLMLPLGTVIAALTIWSITQTPTQAVGGPVMLANIVGSAVDIPSTILIAGVISWAIGVFNMLPITPLDGGKIVEALLMRFGPVTVNMYRNLSFMLFLALIGLALFSDFVR